MTNLKKPLKRLPLHMDVANLLRDMIIEGALPEGEHIKELALCEQLDVSRTPLREALKVLHNEGLVVIEANRGSWVAKISGDEYFETFEIISVLERKAVEILTTKLDTNTLLELKELHQQMEIFFENKLKEKYFSINQTIHKFILDHCGNGQLQKFHAQLINLVARGRFLAIGVDYRWQESMEEHRALMSAIENGDATEAGRILESHVMHTGYILREMFSDGAKIG